MLREQILNTVLAPGQAALFYLGQLGFLLKYAGRCILIDPYLSDLVDRKNGFAPGWTRNYAVPLQPEALDFVDWVFCTHGHCDHADPETLPIIARVCPKAVFYVPAPIGAQVAGFGIAPERVVGVRAGEVTALADGISVTPFPAAHEQLHRDAAGDYEELGYRFRLGTLSICHTGDCCPYDGLEAHLAGCTALILPVNGRDYFRYSNNIIGNFDCVEAVTVAKAAGAQLLIPAHYDLYDANGLNPAIFVDTLYRLNPTQRFHMFAPGEGYLLSQ